MIYRLKKYIRYRKRIKILKSLGYKSNGLLMIKDHCFPLFKEDLKSLSDISFKTLFVDKECNK